MPFAQLHMQKSMQSSLLNVCNMKPSFCIMLIVYLSLLMINAHSRNIPVHTPLPPDDSEKCLPDEVKIDDPTLSTSPLRFIPANDVPVELYGKCVKCTEFSTFGEECKINTIRLQVITITQTKQFNGQAAISCRSDNGYQKTSVQCSHKGLPGHILYHNQYMDCFTYSNLADTCYQCLQSSGSNSCYVCRYGYYRVSDGSSDVCKPISSQPTSTIRNCMYPQNGGPLTSCRTCPNTHYLDTNNICQPCTSPCLQCSHPGGGGNPIQCDLCQLGYTISGATCTTPTFVTCPNCQQCIRITTSSNTVIDQCIECAPQSYPLRQLTGCTSNCSQIYYNCDKCYISRLDFKTKCRKCQDGFHVDWDGDCMKCSDSIPNCKVCRTSYVCTECEILHYLNAGNICSPCTEAGVNCIQCRLLSYSVASGTQDFLTCTQCKPGRYPSPIDTIAVPIVTIAQCLSLCLSNCKICTGARTCTTCKHKFYLSSDASQCQNCSNAIPNCIACHYQSLTATCLRCQNNNTLQRDSDDPTRFICGPCSHIHANCVQCQKFNICTKCDLNSGTYVDFDSNSCKPCIYPCKTCEKKFKCVQCAQPWMVVINTDRGDCQECSSAKPGCLECQSISNPRSSLNTIECTKCKTGHDLQTNPFAPTQCYSCMNVYLSRWINNSILQCVDKCGDKKIITLDCDLDFGSMYDGCTTYCQVEEGFVCELYYSINHTMVPDKSDKAALTSYIHSLPDKNSTEHYYSRCSYDNAVNMSIRRIIKERFENKLSIQVGLHPFLHSYNFLTVEGLQAMFSLAYNNSQIPASHYTTELSLANRSVLFTLTLQHHLTQPLTIHLTHTKISSEPRNFTRTQNSSLVFLPLDQTGTKAFFYSEDQLTLWKSVYAIMQVLSAIGLAATIVSVALKNLAGIEFLWILQAMYFSIFWYEQPLTLPIFSLSGLSLTNGINPSAAFQKTYAPHSTTRLLYESSFQNNGTSHFVELQFTVAIFPIVYILSSLMWVLEDVKNPTVVIWARYFNEFLFNDGLLLAALFMLQSLINQTFALYYAWDILQPFSQFVSANLIAFGIICMALILIGWFKSQQPKHEKTLQHKNKPIILFLQAFSRYNMPLVKQKFYSMYIMIMVLAAFASVFGSFYPLMPILLYIFLAFIISVYKPYNKTISNYRAIFFALVIAFGYFIRVVYIFSFAQSPLTNEGYTLSNTWVIYFWMILVVIAFVFSAVEVFKDFRHKKEMAVKMKEEFKQKIEGQNKILHNKMVQQAKKYQSHKKPLENHLYNNYYHHQIGPQVQIQDCKDLQQIEKNLEQIKKKTLPKPVEKEEVFYISNKNHKRPQKQSTQAAKNEQFLQKNNLNNKNEWLLQAKKKIQQQKLQKTQQTIQFQLNKAYELIMKVMDNKDKLIEENIQLWGSSDASKFDIMTKLVNLQKAERLKKIYEEGFENQNNIESPSYKVLEGMIHEMKEEKVDQFKAVKACQKHKKERYNPSNFPQVEIHFKKAQKQTEEEKHQRIEEKKRMQLQAEERMLNGPDEKVRMTSIKKQLKGMTLNNDAQKKKSKPKNY